MLRLEDVWAGEKVCGSWKDVRKLT